MIRVFEKSDENLAIALGRPLEEVRGWTGGAESVDDDVVMKACGIAKERGIEIERPGYDFDLWLWVFEE